MTGNPARHAGMRWGHSLGTQMPQVPFPISALWFTPMHFCAHCCLRQGPAASLPISQGKAVWQGEQNSPRDSRIFP